MVILTVPPAVTNPMILGSASLRSAIKIDNNKLN